MALSSTQNKKITVIASLQGLEKAENALIRLGFGSKIEFAKMSLLSRSTVTRFFQRSPIQLDSFRHICKSLKLDYMEIMETVKETPEQLESDASDETQHNTGIPISPSDQKALGVGVQFSAHNIHYDFQGANFYSGVAIHNHAPEQKQSITYNFQGANFYGGVAIHNHAPEQKQNLVEAVAEIQQLLKQLDTTHSCNTTVENMTVASEAIKLIESKPKLKQKIINALKEGGTEAFKEFLSHPSANFVIGALADWQKSDGDSMS